MKWGPGLVDRAPIEFTSPRHAFDVRLPEVFTNEQQWFATGGGQRVAEAVSEIQGGCMASTAKTRRRITCEGNVLEANRNRQSIRSGVLDADRHDFRKGTTEIHIVVIEGAVLPPIQARAGPRSGAGVAPVVESYILPAATVSA